MSTRPNAVAGTFYPSDRATLQSAVKALLQSAAPPSVPDPQALVAPHAGYVYSGSIAAAAYRSLETRTHRVRRVVLIGPAHRVYLRGMALPSVEAFETPLGDVPLDREAIQQALSLPATLVSDEAHALEHSLEVHLPFLQTVLNDFQLIPIVVGDCAAADVARVLELLWDDETLILVSSDLSHYHAYATARRLDADTSARIAAKDEHLDGEQACGAFAINGLMHFAKAHALQVSVLDVRNSGDTAGDRRQVVGYGAYALH